MPIRSIREVAMTHLPVHQRTGLTAIGLLRDGRPIWPVMGGDGTTDPPAPPAPTPPAPPVPPADPPKPDGDKPLGEGGEKALAAERARNRELEKELTAFRKAKQDKEDAEKTEAERRTAAETKAAAEALRADRAEVAHEKGLTPAQAKRLVGNTKEELLADADQILIDFPVAPGTPALTAPKPDPSQGSKGTAPAARPTSLGQAVGAALKKA